MIKMWTPLLIFLGRRTPYLFHFFDGSRSKSNNKFIIKACRGCWRVNKSSTHKLIDYKRGKRCLFPTNNHCSRRTKAKYLLDRPYLTRRRLRIKAFKTKGTHSCWVCLR